MTKEPNMKTIRENLLTLRAVIEAAPLEKFNLGTTAGEGSCGTSFCVFGWAAACQQFPGLKWEARASRQYHKVTFNGQDIDYDSCSDKLDVLFGKSSHGVLFQYAGDGRFDRELGYKDVGYNNHYSDAEQKALALARIDKQLESHP